MTTPTLDTAKLERIRAACRRAIELGEAAWPVPWVVGAESGTAFLYSDNPGIDADFIPGLDDIELYQEKTDIGLRNHAHIAHARTFSPAAARALLAAIEAAESGSAYYGADVDADHYIAQRILAALIADFPE